MCIRDRYYDEVVLLLETGLRISEFCGLTTHIDMQNKILNIDPVSYTHLVTIHGKGTYVTATNTELLLEEQKKELESDLERVIQKGR